MYWILCHTVITLLHFTLYNILSHDTLGSYVLLFYYIIEYVIFRLLFCINTHKHQVSQLTNNILIYSVYIGILYTC